MSADQPTMLVFPTVEDMSTAAAAAMAGLINRTVAQTGLFTLVLSGGSTPQRLYRCLAETYASRLPWEQIHLFWGDERGVPPNHPESNFRLAFESLIASVRIPYQNIHRIRGEDAASLEDAAAVAAAYDRELRAFAHEIEHAPSLAFNLLLLGMGEDGHTASLFPGSTALAETRRWVVAVDAPAAYAIRTRVSMTLPLINQAQNIFVLAAGAAKRPLVEMIQRDAVWAAQNYPIPRVQPVHPITWFLDAAAAPAPLSAAP